MRPPAGPQHRLEHGRLKRLLAAYFTFDPRSLGAFRIALAVVLLWDLSLRYREVDTWYTDLGLIPTWLVSQPHVPHALSLFRFASTHGQAVAGMALCALVYLLLLVGFKTRLFQLLALVAIISLNNRVFVLETGAQIVVNLLCIFSLFLPLGARFSVDALLAERRGRGVVREQVASLAPLALLLQLAVIYGFGVGHKSGAAWWNGSAVHYALQDDRMATALGVWVRENAPYGILQASTWGTLLIEALAVIFILSPWCRTWLRLLAFAALGGLHIGIGLLIALGVFSQAMICYFVLLLPGALWDRWGFERPGPIVLPWATGGLVRRSLACLREIAVVLIMAAGVGDLANDSPLWPRALRFRQPEIFREFISNLRIIQKWEMYSPQPPRNVVGLLVHAQAADGRLVDPYREVAGRLRREPEELGRNLGPAPVGQSQFFATYSDRIGRPGFQWLHPALIDWVWAYPFRTGRDQDEIVRISAYRVTYRKPAPRRTETGPVRRKRIASYP